MTKKHFILLAAALKSAKPDPTWRGHYDQWQKDVETIAEALKSTNSLFNEIRFLEACGH